MPARNGKPPALAHRKNELQPCWQVICLGRLLRVKNMTATIRTADSLNCALPPRSAAQGLNYRAAGSASERVRVA
jgi:hypothetical protein